MVSTKWEEVFAFSIVVMQLLSSHLQLTGQTNCSVSGLALKPDNICAVFVRQEESHVINVMGLVESGHCVHIGV